MPARTILEHSFDTALAHLHGRMPGEAADTNFIDLLLALSSVIVAASKNCAYWPVTPIEELNGNIYNVNISKFTRSGFLLNVHNTVLLHKR